MRSLFSLSLAFMVLTLVVAACTSQANPSGVSTGSTPAAKSAGEAPVAATREAVGQPGNPPAPGALLPGASPSPSPANPADREPGPSPSVQVVPTL